MWKMAKKLVECVVERVSLLRKGKRPAVAYAENRFSIQKMRDGEKEKKSKLSKESVKKLDEISERYKRH